MKYCVHCGKEVMDEALICPNCGCSVQYDNLSKSAPTGAGHTGTGAGNIQPPPVPPAADTYSPLSIAGFVCSFFTVIIGLILSIVAFNEAKRIGSQKSMTLSRAGIIISSVMLGIVAFAVIIVIFVVVAALSFI